MNKNPVGEDATKSDETAMRWLSEGLEELVRDCEPGGKLAQEDPHFDLVIVGSGYGGALAADELAGSIDRETGKPMRICVLERGREYLAGMFPSSEADLPGSVSLTAPNSPEPYAKVDGVVDLRLGEDVTVMLANGLGGGSLINAGVMAVPETWVFDQPCWPRNLRQRTALDPYFEAARRKLAPNRNATFDTPHKVKKQAALFRLHPNDAAVREEFKVGPPTPVDSSIAANAAVNAAGVSLKGCARCGDCMTGCNHQAKNSLDQNLLVTAKRRGVRIVCGATVIKLARAQPENNSGPWILELARTDPLLRRRQKDHFKLSTRRVILAAGTLGSTEILLRSKSQHLKFSAQLGERFSTNGDLIAASYGEREEVNAVANESQPAHEREVGPTITGMMKAGAGEDQITIEELAIPGPLRRLFEEGYTTAHLFHRLGTRDPEWLHRPRQGGVDPYGVQRQKIARTQALGVIGHDGAKGRLALQARKNQDIPHESGLPSVESIAVHWPELRKRGGIFDKQVHTLAKLIAASRNGGVLLSNPFWQLLPPRLTQMLDLPRGPAFTTHPLGGCPMADTWHDGVVDEYGRVFNTETSTDVHPGLVVLDGAILPRSLGTNPAFTISAVVLRALEELKRKWDWQPGRPDEAPKDVRPPSYKAPAPAPDIPTKVAIRERLVGPLHLATESAKHGELMLELTLRFSPTSVRELATSMVRTLEVDPHPDESFIRVFKAKVLRGLRDEGVSEYRCEQLASFRARLGGTMRLLDRERSTKPWRILRGLYAWSLNRGLRDVWNRGFEFFRGRKRGKDGEDGGLIKSLRAIVEYVSSVGEMASHAGEVRMFEYDLIVGDPLPSAPGPSRADPLVIPKGTRIRGTKRLTYERRSNPWTQMLEVTLTDIRRPEGAGPDPGWFPQLSPWRRTVLKLEPKHYARERKHLFEITQARDRATGMFELFSFVLHVMRLVAAVHWWSFRKPDAPSSRRPQLLPGALPGVLPPVIAEIPLQTCDEETKEKQDVKVRLTRYRKDGTTYLKDSKLPILLIHGYSASGTTFAHPTLRPSLAKYLYEADRDVWVVDLRTSAGLASSKRPWSFEQVAREDIPAVFEHILKETGAPQIDVVAHCMGAAMFSKALLDERSPIVDRVRHVVLSQVGPMVSFTPANVFRAYAVSYVEPLLRESNFEFRPGSGVGEEFLDRLLATVPYPREEFDFENPLTPWARTPFTATRHRMDAWFGRAFNVANMDADVLEHIDDFFGGINLRTLFQTIHFARHDMITTRRGGNAFVIAERLDRLKRISFLSIHGADNGLADPATLVRMARLMKAAGIPFEKRRFEGFGHQDCIMSRAAATEVFPQILKFLARPPVALAPARAVDAAEKYTAHLPFMGPLVGLPDLSGEVAVAFAAGPKFGPPHLVVWIPGEKIDESWRAETLTRLQSGLPADWANHRLPVSSSWLETAGWYQRRIPPTAPRASVPVLICNQPGATTKLINGSSELTGDVGMKGAVNLAAARGEPDPAAVARALRDLLRRTSLQELQLAQAVLPSPAETVDALRFALSSCQYPAGPLDPGLAAASYARLGMRLDAPERRPRCVVLMGDQIYADASADLFDPTQMEDRYELPYQEWLQTPAVRNVLRRLPLYATFDDHEIENNWERDELDEVSEKRRKMSLEAFFRVQRAAVTEWTPARPAKPDEVSPAWFETTIDGFDFFFVDGRSERQKRTIARLHTCEIIDAKQQKALSDWLDRNRTDGPRFVVSSSILLPRRKLTACGPTGAINSDAWDGYPASFHRLLAYIANRDLRNLVFLSGDEHHSCIATARLVCLDGEDKALKEPTVLHSIHSSALYAPFTFANGEPALLAGEECFTFSNPEQSAEYPAARIRCEVSTHFVTEPGDGFAMLDCQRRSEAGWQIRCEFSRPDGSVTYRLGPSRCEPVTR